MPDTECKLCIKCKEIKPKADFSGSKSHKDKLCSACKKCRRIESAEWYQRNKDRKKEKDKEWRLNNQHKIKQKYKDYYTANKGVINKKSKEYYQHNKDLVLERQRSYYNENKTVILDKRRRQRQKNPEKYKQYYSLYNQQHKEHIRNRSNLYYALNTNNIKEKKIKYQNNKCKIDPCFKLGRNLRRRLSLAIKNDYKSGSAVRDLGCSIQELKRHLESQFQPGMTWENWSYRGWHIDHIKPLSLFDLTDPEQLKQACHYTNLQPLWAKDNLRKNCRYEEDSESRSKD